MKYIRFTDESMIIFSDTFSHIDMVRKLGVKIGDVVSAGFVNHMGTEDIVFSGSSHTLEVGSQPSDDYDAFWSQIRALVE